MAHKKPQKIYITTAIDYANDVIHVGHAYEKILADCCVRYFRNILGSGNVYFTTGTDEHGIKNQKSAQERKLSPQDHVDDISKKDKEQIDSLNISYNRFIRTTDEDHKKTAAEIFKKVFDRGDIYKAKYKGLYCEGCESYKTLSDLNEEGYCPYHRPDQLQKIEEENYFFKWSKYTDFLKDLVRSNDFVLPEGRKKEMLAFLESGLQDIPVSRPKYKLGWGITTPNDETQVIYVWFDALVNYYTFAKNHGLWNKNTKIIHFVGKDISRWHALLWPAMLKSAGLKTPDTVYIHGFINLDGQKISKSKGNVVRPEDLVKRYGSDAVRYYFLKHGPVTEDVSISISHLEEVFNADLANGLGNTVSRLAKLAEDLGEDIPLEDLGNLWENLDPGVFYPIKDFRVDLIIQNTWKKLDDLNSHINEKEPWVLLKSGDRGKLREILTYEINELRKIAILIEPFIPETVKKIQTQFSSPRIKSGEPLFPRIK